MAKGKRHIPEWTIRFIKKALRMTDVSQKEIAKRAGTSVGFVGRQNFLHGIRSARGWSDEKISPRQRRFIVKALGLAKGTSLTKIAERAGVSGPTVSLINVKEGIRNKAAINRGRLKLNGRTVESIINAITSKPDIPLSSIAKRLGVKSWQVYDINRRFDLRPKPGVREKPRLFSPEEKWALIERHAETIRNAAVYFTRFGVSFGDLLSEARIAVFEGLDNARSRNVKPGFFWVVSRNALRNFTQRNTRRMRRETELDEERY